jgi:hypothetical protein
MNRAVTADQARTVEHETDRQALEHNFLERLIERPLQERAVHGEERLEPGARQTGHHVHRVGLADARVPRPVREPLQDLGEARAVRHCGRARNDLFVPLHEFEKGVGRRGGERATRLPDLDAAGVRVVVELRRRVKLGGVTLGRLEPLALDRLDVEHHRTVELASLGEELDQGRDAVPVDRSDGDEPEVLEPGALGDHRLGRLTHLVVGLVENRAARHMLQNTLGATLEVAVDVAQTEPVEILRHSALRARDRHAVVVEHDQELTLERTGVVQALHRDAVDD